MDGFGRVRVLLISLPVALFSIINIYGTFDNHNNYLDGIETRDEFISECVKRYRFVGETRAEANANLSLCQGQHTRRQENRAYQRESSIYFLLGTLFLGALVWFATGLVGWIFRGFTEKETETPTQNQ